MSIKGQGHWWKVKLKLVTMTIFPSGKVLCKFFLVFISLMCIFGMETEGSWKNVSPGLTFLDIFLDIQWMYIPSNVLEKNIYYIYIYANAGRCAIFFQDMMRTIYKGF